MAPPIQFYGRLAGKLAACVAIICMPAVVGISDLQDTVPMLDTRSSSRLFVLSMILSENRFPLFGIML